MKYVPGFVVLYVFDNYFFFTDMSWQTFSSAIEVTLKEMVVTNHNKTGQTAIHVLDIFNGGLMLRDKYFDLGERKQNKKKQE